MGRTQITGRRVLPGLICCNKPDPGQTRRARSPARDSCREGGLEPQFLTYRLLGGQRKIVGHREAIHICYTGRISPAQ